MMHIIFENRCVETYTCSKAMDKYIKGQIHTSVKSYDQSPLSYMSWITPRITLSWDDVPVVTPPLLSSPVNPSLATTLPYPHPVPP